MTTDSINKFIKILELVLSPRQSLYYKSIGKVEYTYVTIKKNVFMAVTYNISDIFFKHQSIVKNHSKHQHKYLILFL